MTGGNYPTGRTRFSTWQIVAAIAVIALAAASCGDDGSADAPDDGGATGDDADAMVNACPEDGCTIAIDDIVREGGELRVTWTPNFDPEVARNHIHVYWDTWEPGQVSGDAVSRGVEQGSWVPTDASPDYLTQDATSVSVRGDSTTLCVTAADREHSVLDELLEDCRDVSDLLS